MSPNFFITFLCIAALAHFGDSFSVAKKEQLEWTNLKVHFSLNPFSEYFYQTQPRTKAEFENTNDWLDISTDCENGGKYSGYRFVEAEQSSMALLFDVQGTIAGIQQILNKAELEIDNDFEFDKVPMYNVDVLNGEEVYVVTAYFVDPSTICSSGRTPEELESQGTGTKIQLQNGTSPLDLVDMPRRRDEAIAQGWSDNACFIGMGYHNFYKVDEMSNTNCKQVVPFFGMYDNTGEMLGFGFASTGLLVRNLYENPPPSAVEQIVGETVPQCLLDQAASPGLSTMHVYFTDSPHLYFCIL